MGFWLEKEEEITVLVREKDEYVTFTGWISDGSENSQKWSL